MPATLIPNIAAVQLLSPGIVPALALDRVFVAADAINGNAFLASGNDLLVMYNSDSAPHTVLIKSAADPEGRFADLTYTVQPGAHSFINITTVSLYTQPTTNQVLITASDARIGFLVFMNA